ncbi:MAG: hypothetical protein INH41_07140 [Myxococcaceae bacterium]|jgi:hypothetical protein|nr:hypothetical protein [Myxococcaceae bacterium]
MQVRLSQPRHDCLVVERGRRWRRCGFLAAGLLAVSLTAALLPLDEARGLVALVGLAPVLATLAVLLLRAGRLATWTLVRTQGRLLVDGEPVELARVELRVEQMPLTRVPTGYALSLWVMSTSGPVDVPLGSYRTLLEAATVSGTVEDFVQRANVKQPGHTGA